MIELVLADEPAASHDDRAVSQTGEHGRISDWENGSAVDEHVVETVTEVVEDRAHGRRAQELARVGRGRTGTEHGERVRTERLEHVVELVTPDEDVGETDRTLETWLTDTILVRGPIASTTSSGSA